MGFPVFVSGRGKVDSDEIAVDTAVHGYDERLAFAQHPETRDYCVFIKMPPNTDGFFIGTSGPYTPILGLGPVIPHPDVALKRLYETDAVRHGNAILDRMNRENAKAFDASRAVRDNESGQVAEIMEWGTRKKGAHPSPRVFVPASVKE